MGNLSEILAAHRRLLWPLAPAERELRLAAIRADYEYEHLLSVVSAEMAADVEPELSAEARGGMLAIMLAEAAVIVFTVGAAILLLAGLSGGV